MRISNGRYELYLQNPSMATHNGQKRHLSGYPRGAQQMFLLYTGPACQQNMKYR